MTFPVKNAPMTSNEMGMHRTLHKIQGNKFKLLPNIGRSLIKAGFDADSTWVEPFFGSGVVGFNLAPEKAYFYDINPNIIGLYAAIKSGELTLHKLVKAINKHKKIFKEEGDVHYYQLREAFNKKPDPLTFLILNRVSYNGLVRFSKRSQSFNVPYGQDDLKLTDTLVDDLMGIYALIAYKIKHNDWHFKVSDFNQAIQSHEADNRAVVFCDPPYLGRDTQYFTNWKLAEEEQLFNILSSLRGSFVLTTWFGEYQLVMNEQLGRYDNGGLPTQSMPKSSTNEAFNLFWKSFSYDTLVHKYIIAGAKKRTGVYEAIIYKRGI